MDAYIAICIALVLIDIALLYALSKMKKANIELSDKIIKLTGQMGSEPDLKIPEASDAQQARKLEILGRLAIGIAHDFNNVLQVINGQSELMLHKFSQYPDVVKNLQTVIIAGEKGASLARQLLVFSRKKETELKPVDVNAVIKPMKKMLERVIGENIHLNVNFNPRCSKILADEVLIEEILMNLTVNARDAMLFGGSISIKIEDVIPDSTTISRITEAENKTYLRLSVQDEGEGIPKEIIKDIFDPFFTTKTDDKGTGLGLATVYGITRQLGGFIDVNSKLGIGTTFYIYLPASDLELEVITEAPIEEETYSNSGKSVLVLEDDAMVNRLIHDVIVNEGINVYSVYDIEEAKAVYQERKEELDLIVSDIILPDGNGPEFVKSLIDEGMTIPFILISGYTEDKMQVERIIDKEHYFLHKPFTVPDLRKTVNKALSGE